MRAHVVWSRRRETSGWRRILGGVEWVFLLAGLAALDVYVWINTSSTVYEAYEDWAFDQDLRGLAPSPMRFAGEQMRVLFGREWSRPEARSPDLARKRVAPGELKRPELTPREGKPPAPTEVIGRLEIPNLHLTAMVREGADSRTLRRAVGHIPGTALPGGQGNVGLAGHRDTFFRELRHIHVNDLIEVQTEGASYRYSVETTQIVGPRDVHVLASSSRASLTLVTCYPFYYVGSAPKRFIVRAGLVSAAPASVETR